MLQDLDAGQQLETAHICEAPLEVARVVGQSMPVSEVVTALITGRASKL